MFADYGVENTNIIQTLINYVVPKVKWNTLVCSAISLSILIYSDFIVARASSSVLQFGEGSKLAWTCKTI